MRTAQRPQPGRAGRLAGQRIGPDAGGIDDQAGGNLANVFKGTRTKFCVVSFTSDWLFPTSENKDIVRALNAAAANVSFVEIQTDKGHDAFLLDEPEMFSTLKGFVDGCAEQRGLNGGRA